MILKSCASVLLCWGLACSQTQVSVSGTVKSARTGQPVADASVKLVSSLLVATTDASGSFALSGSTAIRRGSDRSTPGMSPGSSEIRFWQDADGPVLLRVLDPAGTQRAVLHSGFLGRGEWVFAPPALLPGVHILSIESSKGSRSVRFVSGMESGQASLGASNRLASSTDARDVAGRSWAATADTLLVTKNGFRAARVPLASLEQSGLAILLEDSSDGNVDDAAIVPDPSWPCYMPDGIPPPKLGTAAFSITLQIGAIRDVGLTRFGKRRQIDIKGGSVTGDRITATVLTGALDYELTLSNGSMEIEQIVILRAGSTPILMRNAGVAPVGAKNARMVLDFEAPNSSSYAWLNTGKWAAIRVVDTVAKTIRLDVHDISKATLPAAKIQIKDPATAENQSWDCPTQTGGQGAQVLTETVTLGSSISIGASKRGSRNIIPITGGTTSGKVAGKILDGGADYQLGGLDARYTLAPNDGELIIVRNCGPGSLYPVFEARVDGPYNFLNVNKYASSGPGMVSGGVTITFYEKK